jgi:hypothetical protein
MIRGHRQVGMDALLGAFLPFEPQKLCVLPFEPCFAI